MEKTIKMSLETAREIYTRIRNQDFTPNETDNFVLKLITDTFTKEELEGKKGFTWEESFKPGYIIDSCPAKLKVLIKKCCNPAAQEHFKDQFATEKQALSALAFAQLSHIVTKYNDHPTDPNNIVFYVVRPDRNGNLITHYTAGKHKYHLSFDSESNAKISLEVNRQLWSQYWML